MHSRESRWICQCLGELGLVSGQTVSEVEVVRVGLPCDQNPANISQIFKTLGLLCK